MHTYTRLAMIYVYRSIWFLINDYRGCRIILCLELEFQNYANYSTEKIYSNKAVILPLIECSVLKHTKFV